MEDHSFKYGLIFVFSIILLVLIIFGSPVLIAKLSEGFSTKVIPEAFSCKMEEQRGPYDIDVKSICNNKTNIIDASIDNPNLCMKLKMLENGAYPRSVYNYSNNLINGYANSSVICPNDNSELYKNCHHN